MFKKFFVLFFGVLLACSVSSCSVNSNDVAFEHKKHHKSASKKKKSEYPQTRNEEQLEKMGKIGGEDGLLNRILGFGGSSKSSDGTMVVDGYLWRAVVDTTYKLPIERIDPQYGILFTDWHTLPNAPGVRYKLNIYITSDRLHADSVKVSAFKQRKIGTEWTEVGDADALARSVEERILFKARALKVSGQ